MAALSEREGRLPRIALGGVAIAALMLLSFQFATSNRGLDLGDESFSLSLVSQPQAALNGGDVFLYGFVAHPLLIFLQRDITAYRIAGLILIISASTWMTIEAFLFLRGRACLVSKWTLAAVALVCGLATLPAFTQRSLGYRTLTLLGLMVAVAGLLRVSRGCGILGGAVVGLAGVFTFTAKPTSAAALAAASILFLIPFRAEFFRALGGMLLGVSIGLLGLVKITGLSLLEIFEFLRRGYLQVSAYDSYQSAWAMLGFANLDVASLRGALVLGLAILIPVSLLWPIRRSAQPNGKAIGAMIALAVGTLAASWLAVVGLSSRGWASQVQPVALLLPLTTVLIWIGSLRRAGDRMPNRARSPQWVILFLLLAMPYIASVGTNTLFVYNMGQACVFWVLALAMTLMGAATPEGRQAALTGLGMWFACCLLALGLVARFNDGGPGRSDYSADRPVRIAGGILRLNDQDARALDVLEAVRRNYHLDPSIPSIDLTGFGLPGYQFQLGTRPLGRGTYYWFEGAMEAARRGLALEPCAERARAWLLYAPDNRFDISPAYTRGQLNLALDYQLVGSFAASQGRDDIKGMTVQILRPTAQVMNKLGC